jgi:hypothetical protein
LKFQSPFGSSPYHNPELSASNSSFQVVVQNEAIKTGRNGTVKMENNETINSPKLHLHGIKCTNRNSHSSNQKGIQL